MLTFEALVIICHCSPCSWCRTISRSSMRDAQQTSRQPPPSEHCRKLLILSEWEYDCLKPSSVPHNTARVLVCWDLANLCKFVHWYICTTLIYLVPVLGPPSTSLSIRVVFVVLCTRACCWRLPAKAWTGVTQPCLRQLCLFLFGAHIFFSACNLAVDISTKLICKK